MSARVVLRWLPVVACALLVISTARGGNSAAAFAWGVAGLWSGMAILWEGLVREQSRLIADQGRVIADQTRRLRALRGVR